MKFFFLLLILLIVASVFFKGARKFVEKVYEAFLLLFVGFGFKYKTAKLIVNIIILIIILEIIF